VADPEFTAPNWVGNPRWRLLPESIEPDVDDMGPDGVRRLIRDGIRVLDWPDGALEIAAQVFPTAEITPFGLPERLGGGYLFTSEVSGETAIWRAPTWTANAVPVATLTERVERLVPGFDRLYVQLAQTYELAAFDLGRAVLTDLGPLPASHSYRSLAFADDWFGAVHTDVRGLLATFDAGATWYPVDAPSSNSAELSAADGTITLQTSSGELRLTRQGELEQSDSMGLEHAFAQHNDALELGADADASSSSTRAAYAQPLGPRPVRQAVLHGWPLDDDRAVVASHGNLGLVELNSGRIVAITERAYAGGEPCRGVKLGPGIGFICSEPGLGTSVFRFDPPLAMTAVTHFAEERAITPSDNGLLTVRGGCDAVGASEVLDGRNYCVIGKTGRGREVRVEGDVGAERVVALRSGAIAVLTPPRFGGQGKLSLIGDELVELPLRHPKTTKSLAQLLSHGLWLNALTQTADDQIATWVTSGSSYVGVHIALDGRVTLPKQADDERGDLARAALSGAFALEISASGVGWQSRDYGFHWQQLSLPRVLDPLTPTRLTQPALTHPTVGCSAVGCNYDPWLLIGYATEPSPAEAGAESANSEAEAPKRVSLTTPAYDDWRMNCFATGKRHQLTAAAREGIEQLAVSRPRSGLSSGFARALASSAKDTGITDGAYRPFWGIDGPKPSRSSLLLDMGHEAPVDFRAYAWGERGDPWAATSGWLIRVAPRFGDASLWSTAATRTPWRDWVDAARRFGSDRSNRYSTEWVLGLDPDETSGALWVNSRENSELHAFSRDQAIISLGKVDSGKPAGVVRVRNATYIGVREGNRLGIHMLSGGRLVLVGHYPVGQGATATLVRTTDEQRLGILVHALRGDWYLFPLDDQQQPSAPLTFSREQLNRTPPACSSESEGWLVLADLPLSRIGAADSGNAVIFAEPHDHWNAERVSAKVIATDSALCVSELAAKLKAGPNLASAFQVAPGLETARIPLTVTDSVGYRQFRFRCEQ
jgi:hypothetical protein